MPTTYSEGFTLSRSYPCYWLDWLLYQRRLDAMSTGAPPWGLCSPLYSRALSSPQCLLKVLALLAA